MLAFCVALAFFLKSSTLEAGKDYLQRLMASENGRQKKAKLHKTQIFELLDNAVDLMGLDL